MLVNFYQTKWHYILESSISTLQLKATPVTGGASPQGTETLRLPHFLDNWLTDGSEFVSLTRRPPFTPLALISVRA
jgi:hypothetical protein